MPTTTAALGTSPKNAGITTCLKRLLCHLVQLESAGFATHAAGFVGHPAHWHVVTACSTHSRSDYQTDQVITAAEAPQYCLWHPFL